MPVGPSSTGSRLIGDILHPVCDCVGPEVVIVPQGNKSFAPSSHDENAHPKQTLGSQGEEFVCAYLIENGYRILERNWRCAEGEIDVVAVDAGEIVVVEVKTRRSLRFGPAVEAVTHDKHLRLRRLAALWMREREVQGRPVRIDVVGVEVSASGIRVDHRRRVML